MNLDHRQVSIFQCSASSRLLKFKCGLKSIFRERLSEKDKPTSDKDRIVHFFLIGGMIFSL